MARSWGRSAADGAGRDATHLPPLRLWGGELAAYRDRGPFASVLAICRDLLGDTARDTKSVFAVGDAEGVLLLVEGDPSARRQVECINFVEGAVWSEKQAGTNAPGTALELDAALQILAVEHYNEAVRPWSCAAAPIHDPDSGRLLGVIDLTGGGDVASPHALALVRAVARAAESELARRLALDDRRVRAAYDRRPRVRGTAALVSPGGRVLNATGDLQITGLSWLEGAGEGCGTLPDGRRLVIEPVGPDGYLVVRFVAAADPAPRRTAVRLSALGRDNAVIEIDGRSVQLSPRHSEIAVILALAGEGLSAGRLAVDLSLDAMSNVTVRADMCRLRTALGESLVGSQPYQFLRPIRSDAHAVRDLLAEGRPGDALDIYPGPLLPSSQAPAIVERREALDQQLRGSVLAGRDSKLLRRWVDAPWGAEDLLAWETLAGLLPGGSPQRAAAALRAQALRG